MKKGIFCCLLVLIVVCMASVCYADEADYTVEAKMTKLAFDSFATWKDLTKNEEDMYRFVALTLRDADNGLDDHVFNLALQDEVLFTNMSGLPLVVCKSSIERKSYWLCNMGVDISVYVQQYYETGYEVSMMTQYGIYADTRFMDMKKLSEAMKWNPPSADSMVESSDYEALFRNADDVWAYRCGWFPFQLQDQGGFMNVKGEYMTGWNYVQGFDEYGVALVYRGNMSKYTLTHPAYDESSLFGLIDVNGEEVLPCEYNKLTTPAYEGVYKLRKETSGKFSLFDVTSRTFIDVSEYDFVSHICDGGMIAVFQGIVTESDQPKEGKWGYIDKTGKLVIPLQYEKADYSWSESGYAYVKMNGKYGAIDRTGKLCIPCTWDSISMGDGQYALGKRDEKYYVIDMNGAIVSAIQQKNAYFDSAETVYVYDDYDVHHRAILDVQGNVIIEGDWYGIDQREENLFSVSTRDMQAKKNSYGIYDASAGKLIVPMVYDEINYTLSDNRRLMKQLGYYGFFDENFQVTIPAQYEDAISFRDGYAAVKLNGRWQIIDTEGNVVY